MYNRINLDEKKKVRIPVYSGIKVTDGTKSESIPNDCVLKEKEYKTSIFTDGEVEAVERKIVNRESLGIISLSKEEIDKVKFLFDTYPCIDEVEIAYVTLKNPTFYVSLTIVNGRNGKMRRVLLLEELQEYATKPVTFATRRNIQRTYEDIKGLVENNDATVLNYFLGTPQMFRMNYEEVNGDIYQLKKGNIK